MTYHNRRAGVVVLVCAVAAGATFAAFFCRRASPEEAGLAGGAEGAAPEAAAGSSAAEPDHLTLLPPLLRPFLGDLADSIEVVRARPDPNTPWEWGVDIRVLGEGGELSKLHVYSDYNRSYVCYLRGPSLAAVDTSSPESIQAAATDYARQHLGPWSENSCLVETHEDNMGCVRFTWANVLPSGARTGYWWGVTVDKKHKCIMDLMQHHALREVGEGSVKVTREQALAIAERLVQPSRDKGSTATLKSAILYLSAIQAPEYGPAWYVSYTVKTPETEYGDMYLIDGMTGERLGYKPWQPAEQGGAGDAAGAGAPPH